MWGKRGLTTGGERHRDCPAAVALALCSHTPFSSSASSSHPGLLSIIQSGKVNFCLQQSSAPRCPLPGYIDWDWCRAGSSFPSAGNLTVASAQPFQTPHLAGVQDPVVALCSFSMEQLLFPFTFLFHVLSIFPSRP